MDLQHSASLPDSRNLSWPYTDAAAGAGTTEKNLTCCTDCQLRKSDRHHRGTSDKRCLTDTLAHLAHTVAESSVKASSGSAFNAPPPPCLLGATTLYSILVYYDLVPWAGIGDRADTTPSAIAPVGTSNRGSTDVQWRLLAAVIDPWRALSVYSQADSRGAALCPRCRGGGWGEGPALASDR